MEMGAEAAGIGRQPVAAAFNVFPKTIAINSRDPKLYITLDRG